MHISLLAAAAAVAAAATAEPDVLMSDLKQRLAVDGATKANVYLATEAPQLLNALNRRTVGCDLQAVSLSVQLTRAPRSVVVDAHTESIKGALGQCTGFVLALLTSQEVARFCASATSWTITQTARELRRRIGAIEADELLRSSPRGEACRAAYSYELHHTRVGLRVRKAGSESGPRQQPRTHPGAGSAE